MPSKLKSSRQEAAQQEAADDDTTMGDIPTSHQPAAQDAADEDEEMNQEDAEQNEEEEGEGEEEEEEEEEVQRVRLLPGSTPTAASFEFLEEGHTLGNALRYIIMKNPDVEFCAYAVPHPTEAKMNVRIQTYEGTTAIEALEKGLKDLQDLCDVVAEKFWESREDFATQMSTA